MKTKTKREKRIKAWWFASLAADGKVYLPNGDGREVVAGKTLSVPGPVKLCERGLHASIKAIDALGFARGAMVCRVEVWGSVKKGDDKIAGTHRKVIWMADATTALRLFACDCAEAALTGERKAGREPDARSWASVAVARRFAAGEATEKELAAARDAAWAAAWDAARAASRDAAWDAARAASRDAARDAQAKMLEDRLLTLAPSATGEGER